MNDNFNYEKIYEYQILSDLVDSILKNQGVKKPRLSFSICLSEEVDSDSENHWFVKCPDLESEIPVFEGKCVFYGNEFWGGPQKKSKAYKNPTWKNIIFEANKRAIGDHVFLECVDLKKETGGIKFYEFHFGS